MNSEVNRRLAEQDTRLRVLQEKISLIEQQQRSAWVIAERAELRIFELLEDCSGDGPVKAKWVSRTSASSRGDYDVYGYDNILDGALAGYRGVFGRVDGEWLFIPSVCIEGCTSGGSIAGGSPPAATVGAAYSHGVTETGLTGSASASGLPPGLSYAAGSVSGTPTTAGRFLVVFTGSAAGTGDSDGETCTITEAIEIVVNNA